MTKLQPIVTREGLQKMLDNAGSQKRMDIVGRALIVLFNNQTFNEQIDMTTTEQNGEGFTGTDAKYGTWCAELYIKDRKLAAKTVEKWYKKNSKGISRISKYWNQLNIAANSRLLK